MAYSTPAIPRRYTSANRTVSGSATQLQFAHGLPAIPYNLNMVLVCTTANLNYSIGDVVQAMRSGSNASSDGVGYSIRADATNITIRFGSDADPIRLNNATSGASQPITLANWQLRVEGFY